MKNNTTPIASELKSIFPHEDSLLFRRASALHALTAKLAAEPDAAAGRRVLERAADSAFMTIAAAGAAVSSKDLEKTLCRARKWLSKCSAAIRSLLHRADITEDVAKVALGSVEACKDALPGLPTTIPLRVVVLETPQHGVGAPPPGDPSDDEAVPQAAAPLADMATLSQVDEPANSNTAGADSHSSRPPSATSTQQFTPPVRRKG